MDQFGNPLPIQPPSPWSLEGAGIAFDSASGATVNLDGASPVFADVTFDSTGSYALGQQGPGGTLHLANGASPATLTVTAGSHTIAAPLALDSNELVTPAADSSLTLSGPISGAGSSLTLDGSGELVLSGANSYDGGTTVSAGTLILANASAIADNTSLVVGAGATLILRRPLTRLPWSWRLLRLLSPLRQIRPPRPTPRWPLRRSCNRRRPLKPNRPPCRFQFYPRSPTTTRPAATRSCRSCHLRRRDLLSD